MIDLGITTIQFYLQTFNILIVDQIDYSNFYNSFFQTLIIFIKPRQNLFSETNSEYSILVSNIHKSKRSLSL